MAYSLTKQSIFNALVEKSNDTIEKMKARNAQRAIYRETYKELESLSNRELADIGLNRTMIKSVAIEAAYGK